MSSGRGAISPALIFAIMKSTENPSAVPLVSSFSQSLATTNFGFFSLYRFILDISRKLSFCNETTPPFFFLFLVWLLSGSIMLLKVIHEVARTCSFLLMVDIHCICTTFCLFSQSLRSIWVLPAFRLCQ